MLNSMLLIVIDRNRIIGQNRNQTETVIQKFEPKPKPEPKTGLYRNRNRKWQ